MNILKVKDLDCLTNEQLKRLIQNAISKHENFKKYNEKRISKLKKNFESKNKIYLMIWVFSFFDEGYLSIEEIKSLNSSNNGIIE